jgi:hypothetical protein
MSELTTITTHDLSLDMPADELAQQLAELSKVSRQATRLRLGHQALDLHSALLQQSIAIEAASGVVEPIELPATLLRPDLTSPEVQVEMALQRRSANRQIGSVAGVLSLIERSPDDAPLWRRRERSGL